MKRFSLSLSALAGVGALGLAVGIAAGFGLGRLGNNGKAGEGAAVSELREGGAAAALEPTAVTGQSTEEKAARADVRSFQPGRPFPRGGAEAWLLGLRGEGFDDSEDMEKAGVYRHLATLDEGAAREVVDAVLAIIGRMEADEEGGEIRDLWRQNESMLKAALASALGIVSKEDPEGALALLEAQEEPAVQLVAMVWTEIARSAPGRLESLLAGIDGEDEDVISVALCGAARGLALSDPEAAGELLAKYPVNNLGYSLERDEVIGRVTARDPRRGVEMAAAFARGGETYGLVSAFGEWLGRDEDAARAWLEHYDGPGRDAARGRLLLSEASADPRAAMVEYDAMRARGATDRDLDGVAGAIAGNLADSDPGAAKTWVDALPTGGNQYEAVVSLASVWAKSDAPAASEWIATLPVGGARDGAVATLTEWIQGSDPAAALQWARSIGNERLRRSRTGSILAEWLERNPVAAEAAAALPEAVVGARTGGGAKGPDVVPPESFSGSVPDF